MADNNSLLLTTVSSNDYPQPVKNKDGQWVVSASTVKMDPNKTVLYDPTTRLYSRITPYTVSPDYYRQVKQYENRLAAQTKGWADSADNTQINSVADIFAQGGTFALPFTSKWFNRNAQIGQAAIDYFKDYVIEPATKDTPFLTKTAQLINNGLVNLSETMDWITGANVVKPLLMGEGVEGVKQGMNWDNTGRVQYDWNVKTGNVVTDTVANILLEIVSDPTTYVSFGTTGAIKSIGKEAFSTTILKSADDVGIAITKSQADELAKAAIKSFIYKEDNIANALMKSNLSTVLTKQVPVEKLPALVNALKKNATFMAERQTLELLKSVNAGSDMIQSAALKVAGYSSTLGLGYHAIKNTLKLTGLAGVPFAVAKQNKIFAESGIDNMTYKNMDETLAKVEKDLNTMKDLMGMSETFPNEVLKEVTRTFQETKYEELRNILMQTKASAEVMREGNEWAAKQGFKGLNDFFLSMHTVTSAIPDGLRTQMFDLGNRYSQLYYDAVVRPIATVIDGLKPTKSNTVVSQMRYKNDIRELMNLGVTAEYFDNQLYQDVLDYFNAVDMIAAYNKNRIMLASLEKFGLDTLATVFGKDAKGVPLMNTQLAQKILAMLRKLREYTKGTSLNTATTRYTDEITASLRVWLTNPQNLTVELAQTANIALRELKRRISVLGQELDKINTGKLEAVAKQNSKARYLLRENLKAVLKDYNSKRVHSGKIKTSAVVGKMIDGDIVAKGLSKLLDDTNSPKALQDLYMHVLNTAEDTVIKNKDSSLASHTYRMFSRIIKTLENVDDLTYYAKELGFRTDLDEWATKGITPGHLNDIINKLDDVIDKFKTEAELRYGRQSRNTNELLPDLQNLRDILDSFRRSITGGLESRIKTTTNLISSKAYRVQLSKINALDMLLNTEGVRTVFNNIRHSWDLGQLINVLSLDDAAEDINANAAQVLQSLSKSIYIADEAISAIKKSSFSDDMKDALCDTLAGQTRYGIDEIINPANKAAEYLNASKKFYDGLHNAHLSRLQELSNTGDVLEEVKTLRNNLYGKLHPMDEKYWKVVRDALNKDKDSTINIIYRASQTGYQSGTVYEFAYVLPSGRIFKFVDVHMRDMMLQTLDEETARRLYGQSKEIVLENIRTSMVHDVEQGVVLCNTTDEFVEMLYYAFKEIKEAARTTKRTARLVGFNNEAGSLGTDLLLDKFLRYNEANTKIITNLVDYKSIMSIESLDVAQLLRIKYEGAMEITTDMQNELTTIITAIKNFMDETNSTGVKGALAPDFNTHVTASLRQINSVLDNALAIYDKRNLVDTDFRALSAEQFQIIKHSFTSVQLESFKITIRNMLQSIGDTLMDIKYMNTNLGQYVLLQNAIANASGERNIMQILYKYFIDRKVGGVPALSFKKVFDPAVFYEWFGRNYPALGKDTTTVLKLNDIAEQLQNNKARIKHPLLVMDIDYPVMRDVVDSLKKIFISLPNYKFSEWAGELLQVTINTNQLNNYAIAQLLWNSIKKVTTVDQLDVALATLRGDIITSTMRNLPDDAPVKSAVDVMQGKHKNFALLEYLNHPEDTVMYAGTLHAQGIEVLHSTLVNENNYIVRMLEQLKQVTHATQQAETVQDALIIERHLRDVYGVELPSMMVKEHLVQAYGTFVNRVRGLLDEALDTYTHALPKATTEFEKFNLRKAYTAQVHKVINELEQVGATHAYDKFKHIISMNAQDYVTYLYKYSQGIQMFDMNSKIAKLFHANELAQFMVMLKEAERYGVRYYENPKTHALYVYLDYNAVNLKQLEEVANNFKTNVVHTVIEEDVSGIYATYNQFVKVLDTQFAGTYSLSMHSVMDFKRYDEFIKQLPSEVKDNVIPRAYLDEQRLLDGFNHTIVGDYASGVGSIYTTHSSNVMTNVAAGFNTTYNRLRGIDLYKTLFFNEQFSLRSWLNNLKKIGNVDYKDIRDAISDAHMTVCTYTNGRVAPVDISTPKGFQDALNNGAVLLDYHSYTHAMEVLNDNKIDSKLFHQVNKYLSALKLGQLMSLGWFLRNIPDSTIKGWAQAGLDPMYVFSMFNRTKRVIAQYDATYIKIFTETDGSLAPARVSDFFQRHRNEPDLLDETTFNKLLTFYNDTASTPTATQLNLNKNTAYKLYQRVKGDERIREADVATALNIFKDTDSYGTALKKLNELYPRDIAETLIILRNYVPKEEMSARLIDKVVNKFPYTAWILHKNNDWESFIRAHTYLYHTVYTNGSVSDALRMVDLSQFNRARDTKQKKLIEMLLPFSSFQIDNFLFWTDTMLHGKNNIIALTEDVMNGMYNEDTLDVEELSRNMSLQYLFLSGNLLLDNESGTVLKTNDSLHNVLQMMVNPVGAFAEMVNVPMDVITRLAQAIVADEQEHFYDVKPISQWTLEDYTDEILQLIPLVGAAYQREKTALEKWEISDAILPMMFPSIFGVSKIDNAIPIGYDWYNQTEEYKKTHRYVFGVSYVPAWMRNDPKTYVNTFERLQRMGYSQGTASIMMQTGWYFNKEGILKQYHAYAPYPKRYYAKRSYAKRSYAKRSYVPKKPKKFSMGINKAYEPYDKQYWTTRTYRVRRIYRQRIYRDRYTRTGVSRADMINWGGANRSSRQLIRDRSLTSRLRQQRIARQMKPL